MSHTSSPLRCNTSMELRASPSPVAILRMDNAVIEGVVIVGRNRATKSMSSWAQTAASFTSTSTRSSGRATGNTACPEFEQLYTQKPSNVSAAFLPWGIYSLEPRTAAPAWPFNLDIGDADYPSLVSGWNKQERDDLQSPYWRWTGNHAILRVPWPSTGHRPRRNLHRGHASPQLVRNTPKEHLARLSNSAVHSNRFPRQHSRRE